MTYSKDDFINQLKKQLTDVDHKLIGDYFYEWTVEDWDKLNKKKCEEEVYSPEFKALDETWKLMLYPNGIDEDNKGFISLYLFREKEDDDCFVHFTVNRVFFVRNYNDYTAYYSKTLPIDYLSKTIIYCGLPRFMKKANINLKSEFSNKSLIENNKCVFGVYFQIYKNEKDLFRKEISCLLDDVYIKPKNEGIFEWEVKDWSKSNKGSPAEFSKPFKIGDYRWKLELYKDGENDNNYVSLYLNCLNPEISKSYSFRVNAVFFIKNCSDPECYYLGYLDYQDYNEDEDSFGHNKLIKKKELFKKNKTTKKSVIEDGRCIVGAYVHVYEDKDLSTAFSKMSINDDEKERNEIMKRLDQSPSQQQNSQYQYPPPYYYSPPSDGASAPNQQYPPYQNPPTYYPPPPQNQPTSSSNNATDTPPPYSLTSMPMPMPTINDNTNPIPQYPPYQYPPYQNPSYQNPPYQNPPYQNTPFQNSPYQNMPYQNTPYQNAPYQNAPYQNPPFQNLPYQNQPYQNPNPFYYPPPTGDVMRSPNAPPSDNKKDDKKK